MSKIRELRRKAQQELRSHRFDKAVALYERICESEKSNAGYRNELGDIHLKMGELPQAVVCFREAAALYRDVGLTNNAAAILKKVLRQDPHHFDSLWELGEIRSEQGLETEAVRSFLDYLRTADAVPEGGREAFLQRSAEVLERWGQEPEVLAELDSLFERWGAEQERAQVLVAKAALAREEGEHDIAEKYIEHARAAFPELEILPAYADYLQEHASGAMPAVGHEIGEVHSAPEEDDDHVPEVQIPADEVPEVEIPSDVAPEVEIPDDQPSGSDAHRDSSHLDPQALDLDGSESESEARSQVSGPFDLLDEILSDGDVDLSHRERSQIDTIASEVEGQMAGNVDPSDHAGQYDLGMVYADMGLVDQAITAFLRAAESEAFRLRALEMAGGCRLESGDHEGAIELLRKGLEVRGHSESAYVGLLYFLGRAHEARSERDLAIENYERVALLDSGFKDVSDRLRSLHAGATQS